MNHALPPPVRLGARLELCPEGHRRGGSGRVIRVIRGSLGRSQPLCGTAPTRGVCEAEAAATGVRGDVQGP
eukprot:764833-Hanusia_phi.AAC.3